MSDNNSSKGNGGIGIGVILFFLGFIFPPLLAVAIFVIIISAVISAGKKKIDGYGGEINRGINRSMSQADELAKYRYNGNTHNKGSALTSAQQKNTAAYTKQPNSVRTYNIKYNECSLDRCNPNECPICKSFSANGYCGLCGYWFKHR